MVTREAGWLHRARRTALDQRRAGPLQSEDNGITADRQRSKGLVVALDKTRRGVAGTWINKVLYKPKGARIYNVKISSVVGSGKVLTNLAFTADRVLPSSLSWRSGHYAMFGDSRTGAATSITWHMIQTELGALLCHCPILWPWTCTLWASGLPHLLRWG